MGRFVEGWERGERSGTFESVCFKADVTTTPLPRFDLLRFKDYLHAAARQRRSLTTAGRPRAVATPPLARARRRFAPVSMIICRAGRKTILK